MNFDLVWNYLEGGVSFFVDLLSQGQGYEESASIEVDPVGTARDSSNENPCL